MKKKRIILELRVPKTYQEQEILDFARAKIRTASFELDSTFKPVPAAPVFSMAQELAAAGEIIVNIRGAIETDKEAELKKIPCVADVWTDATGAPFNEK